MGKVTQNFHKDDVPWIQGIPIDMYIEDSLSWPYTPNGQYMVKSGYRVGREINLHPTRHCNMEGIHKWWKMIWSMQLPPRMKLFSWRVCHNWLPAKTNLLHRGMHVNPICESCGNNAETLTHVLWSCAKSKVVLKLIPLYKKWESVRDGSMFDILMSLQSRLDKREFKEAIKLLDWVFSAYSRVILHGEAAIQAGETSPHKPKQCKKPTTDSHCVNCDAAMNQESTGVGLAFIWRNWQGEILLGGMVYLPSKCSIEMAEAWAILEALKRTPTTAQLTLKYSRIARKW
ncbi:hypothetical protein G4B88_030272 [Cannabis sativa]|uniref:Reverse transcriptase zinc-binding domain-containing protein n=1 Tax=Cannabis sativa TaxID=3483 RepID=A0A7J6GEH9_CANSA|nr:hypothetical protein G4B88_030272 [Cannabis sativa]